MTTPTDDPRFSLLVVRDCPNEAPAAEAFEEALALVGRPDTTIRRVLVDDAGTAQRLGFTALPTPSARPSSVSRSAETWSVEPAGGDPKGRVEAATNGRVKHRRRRSIPVAPRSGDARRPTNHPPRARPAQRRRQR